MKSIAIIAAGLATSLIFSSCDQKKETSSPEASSPKTTDGETLLAGTFEGRNDHVVKGGVEIIKTGETYHVQLGDDFSLDNAPDPKVGLGKDGYQKDTQSGNLQSKTGASTYELKGGINPADYNEVYIWCAKFDVALGVAKLSPSK